MKRIRIKFVDFATDFSPEDNEFTNILREKYDVEIVDTNPEYVFHSSFGSNYLKYDCIRIFYTGECITPDFNLTDYALAFDRITLGDRYLRMPLYRLFQYRKKYDMLFDRPNFDSIDKSKEFCNFVVSNCFADDIRLKIYEALSRYKKVNSGGRFRNNVGGPVPDKFEFQRKHKFSIAFENGVYDGYATEKIVDAFAAGTVPIYLGDPRIHLDFNENSFINGHRFGSLEDIVKRVEQLDNDDEKYLEMLNANPIIEDQRSNDDLRSFLFNIFDQDKESAKRRPNSSFSKDQEAFIRRYMKIDRAVFRRIRLVKKKLYRIVNKAN